MFQLQPKFELNDKVKLKPQTNFKHGQGAISFNDIGTIIALGRNNTVRVAFPHCASWIGLTSEIQYATPKQPKFSPWLEEMVEVKTTHNRMATAGVCIARPENEKIYLSL